MKKVACQNFGGVNGVSTFIIQALKEQFQFQSLERISLSIIAFDEDNKIIIQNNNFQNPSLTLSIGARYIEIEPMTLITLPRASLIFHTR